MGRSFICAGITVLLILCLSKPVSGQSEQFWPEVDFYKKLSSKVRLHFVAQQTRENNASTEIDVGADVDFFFKPLVKLERFAGLQVDESKSRPLLLRVGYHYLPSTDGANEQRVIVEATPRLPLAAGAIISDRNRVDLRVINNEFSWRYRNRLTVERNFSLGSFRFAPFVRSEVYYDHKYEKWNRTTVSGGLVVPFRKHFELEAYYEHQNDTSKSPNRQVNALGLTLNLYF
jgi:hypothetical protein